MRRDMDIVRTIILNIEDDKYQHGAYVTLDGVSNRDCALHVALLFDAGLAEGRLVRTDSSGIVAASVERLTSAGHDFCDGIRNDKIWNKAKEQILKPGASYGLSILVEYVKLHLHQVVFGG